MPSKSRWPEYLRLVERDDHLPVRECGPWTEEKLYFWSKYIDIATTAMVGKRQWRAGLAYVDLFAGPGVCRVRESNLRLPGSTIIAAHAPKPFTRIVAVELDPQSARALRARLTASGTRSRWAVHEGDCNKLIDRVIVEVPVGALTLAFLDPEGFDAHFETLRRLADERRVDFLILFADSIDLLRNLAQYAREHESKVDRMLGPNCDWRAALAALDDQSPSKVRELFENLYQAQVRNQLGYEGFRTRQISGPHGPLYRLIFASKHERGVEFWEKVVRRDVSGQADLF
jgi:three-Cys-motif partner protein